MKLFNQKHRLFSQKIKDVTNSIYELEFKVFKSRQMREEARLLRDRAVENVGQLQAQLENTKDKAEKEKITADLEAQQTNKTQYEGQMKLIDEQIHGTEQQPGLLDTMKGLTELREMYKSYIKNI